MIVDAFLIKWIKLGQSKYNSDFYLAPLVSLWKCGVNSIGFIRPLAKQVVALGNRMEYKMLTFIPQPNQDGCHGHLVVKTKQNVR